MGQAVFIQETHSHRGKEFEKNFVSLLANVCMSGNIKQVSGEGAYARVSRERSTEQGG